MNHSFFRLLAAAATLLVAAHSAHAQGEAACLDTARRSVEAARKDMTPSIPANAVKMATIKGKLVWFISPSQATAYALGVSKGFAEAAEAAGLKSQVFDAKGQPTLFNEGVAQAVAAKADAIVTYAIAPALIQQSLKLAAEARIPVIQVNTGLPAAEGIYVSLNPDVEALGKLQAHAALLQTQCKLNGAVVYSSNFPILTAAKNAALAEVKALCPTCEMTELNVQLPTISTQLAPLTSSTMARLPKLNAFIATFDQLGVFMVPAIEQAGRKDVAIIGANGNSANLEFIRQGRVQTYDPAYPPASYLGWQLLDQAARAAAGQKPTPFTVQVQMLDKGNIGPSGTEELGVFKGLAGYDAAFKKAWGLN
ncbi:MAG TPA: substrate-binding domain-containing protein [Ramlibacter sp.]|nr:substrate-binding domain-containing protein [Ramlibacter sp.]